VLTRGQFGREPQTRLEEINGDLREADFWPGTTSVLSVNREQSQGCQEGHTFRFADFHRQGDADGLSASVF